MQSTVTVPEDLTGLDDQDLTDLAEEIRTTATDLAESGPTDAAEIAVLDALVADFERINAEKVAREEQAAERQARVDAALTKFQGDGAEEAPAEGSPSDDAAEVPVPVAAAVQEDAVSDTSVTPAPAAAPAVVAAQAAALAPRADEAPPASAILTASNALPGLREGTELSSRTLADAIVEKQHNLHLGGTGSYERIVMASSRTKFPYRVGGGEEANYEIFANVAKDWKRERSHQVNSLVASGGVCVPLPPSYEFFRLAEEINPVEGTLPVAEAPRGGIRFITPPDYRDAAAGVRVTTEAQDAAGYTGQSLPSPATNDTAHKPCVRLVCPPVEECRVDAVSQCVTFGNLNYRVFPEQVDNFLKDLAVIFTQTKEVFYLDAIDAASTAVTFSPVYSAVRGIKFTLLAAAAGYRRRHHMPAEAVLTLMLPAWVAEIIKIDLINDHAMGMGFLDAGQAEITKVFASMNLDVSFYYDSATGAGQSFSGVQHAGVLNTMPSSMVGYLFAPGTFVRLNAGTLDVGIVRDSVLNGTNDLQMFSEEWIQVCMVGLESLRLDISLCPDGTAPEPVSPMDCLGGSV